MRSKRLKKSSDSVSGQEQKRNRNQQAQKPVSRPETHVLTSAQHEQVIIAAMMRDGAVLRDVTSTESPDLFLAKRHKTILKVFRKLALAGETYSLESFEAHVHGAEYGGRKYLLGIQEAYPSPLVNLPHHMARVKLASLKHHLRTGDAQKLLDLLSNPRSELSDVYGVAREVLKGLENHGIDNVLTGEKLERKYFSDFYNRREEGTFIPTGYAELDENLTEGFATKRVSIITARPTIGKSTFAWNLASRACLVYDIPTIFFALEMNAEAVLDGIISANTGIPLDDLIKFPHILGSDKIAVIDRFVKQLCRTKKLAIWDKSITLEKAACIIREGGYKLAFWDLFEKTVSEKVQDVIARQLDYVQQMAKDTDCHQCLVHQASRRVEYRSDKRPQLSDLKNSGGYEEVADLVLGLYREFCYNPNVEKDILEVGILKQRRGSRLSWYGFEFDGPHGRVGDAVEGWSKKH